MDKVYNVHILHTEAKLCTPLSGTNMRISLSSYAEVYMCGLQLRQCLAGEALRAIEGLGHSATAYHTAKERLDRKFGGQRRQIALYLEEIDNFRPIRPGSSKDTERYADLLDIAIVNLKEANRSEELQDGLLYMKLQKKLPATMLAAYHRWIFENKKKNQ